MQEPTQVYARHRPEGTILYRAVQENFETFLANSQKGGESLPLHVHQEVHAYLRCGILAHGFIRLRCEACKEERLVAFSCKKRGFCPSCGFSSGKIKMTLMVSTICQHIGEFQRSTEGERLSGRI